MAQKKHLVLDMLPLNGDETHVTGGLLPGSALNDGSAEATMLGNSSTCFEFSPVMDGVGIMRLSVSLGLIVEIWGRGLLETR